MQNAFWQPRSDSEKRKRLLEGHHYPWCSDDVGEKKVVLGSREYLGRISQTKNPFCHHRQIAQHANENNTTPNNSLSCKRYISKQVFDDLYKDVES